jgi:diamine N-acetyltransferase
MHNIIIKKADLADLEQLQQIGRQTFFETFAEHNTEADMQEYLSNSFSTAQLASELSNPDAAFYFAMLDEAVIGYLKINTGAAQTEKQASDALEIERIYVLQAFHGQKVGQLLYEKAIAIARQTNAAYVWLGVWEKNVRALNFYRKNGFVEFGKHIFRLGSDVQTDFMMRLELPA